MNSSAMDEIDMHYSYRALNDSLQCVWVNDVTCHFLVQSIVIL